MLECMLAAALCSRCGDGGGRESELLSICCQSVVEVVAGVRAGVQWYGRRRVGCNSRWHFVVMVVILLYANMFDIFGFRLLLCILANLAVTACRAP